jgi:DNA-binding transcriptional LysR family regulator
MDLTSLGCFVAAAHTPSFRAAAARVALSPAAFSERLVRLEEDLGVALFVRTTRRSALTEAGHRLLPDAERLLDDARRLVHHAREPAAAVPYALTIGTRHELGMSWLVPSLGALERAAPERTLHVAMADTPDLAVRLERGTVDAFVSSARLTAPNLAYAALHEETYALVGVDPTVSGPADAPRLTLLDVSPDLPLFRYLLDADPGARPWPFARSVYLGGLAAIRHRVLEAAGIAVLPSYFVEADLAAGRLHRLLPEHPIGRDTFRLVWRRGHPKEVALVALAEALRGIALR